MPLLVTSASGINGDGYGALLAFDHAGELLGAFSNDSRIADPRGLAIEPRQRLLFLNSADRVLALDTSGTVVRDTGVIAGLNPGGGVFGPDGRYYAGLRSARTILALSPDLNRAGEHILPAGVVPFPRGFGFDAAGRLLLASGIGPDGKGDDAILASAPADRTRPRFLVQHDPELSPLDLIVAPNGNVVVSSERPFGAPDAVTSVREYHTESGRLVRVLPAEGWPRCASRAGYASVAMAISTAWLRTKWSHSIFGVAAVLAPSCSFRDCTGKRLFSFLINHAGHRHWG